MKRNYDSGVQDSITFFTGIEIERTPAYGMKTLFVVGVHDPYVIMELAAKHGCEHIYFGANQSFPKLAVNDAEQWRLWEDMIYVCLDSDDDFWCTLDLDLAQVEGLLESGLVEKRQFIPQISVKLPYLQQLGYNATIKIDDKDFKATNPGVWCHSVHELQNRDHFTDWSKYTSDEVIS